MKNYRLHIASMALAASAVLASCSDSYPGLEYNNNVDGIDLSNNETTDKVPIMVFTNEQNYFNMTARGSGSFGSDNEDWNKLYSQADIYVYAFRSKTDAQGELLQGVPINFTPTRWNTNTETFGGSGASDGDGSPVRDCLMDGEGRHGARMHFTKDMPGSLESDGSVQDDLKPAGDGTDTDAYDAISYYSKYYQEVPYNFFAYYLDIPANEMSSSNVTLDRQQKSVKYTFSIDGSQDVMCGYAPFPTKEQLVEQYNENKAAWSEDEINRVLNIGGFSTYAARRDVNPVIKMKHKFVRLDFYACPGDKASDYIRIDGIEVRECPNRVTLTVADEDTARVGDMVYVSKGNIALKDRPEAGSELVERRDFNPVALAEIPDWSFEEWQALCTRQNTTLYHPIGDCIMVPKPEGDSYTIRLYFRQKREIGDGVFEDVDWDDPKMQTVYADYTLKPENGIFAGSKYNVYIKVFGYQKIVMTANVAPWTDGGGVDVVDPDLMEGW